MAAVHSPRCITHFTSFKTLSTASYKSNLPPSFLQPHIRRHSSPMASSSDAAEVPATGNSETASDVLVQYVVLRRDLIDTWPLGSVVTQGCHASVAAIWSHKDDPHTIDYCSPTNLDSMHKANTLSHFSFWGGAEFISMESWICVPLLLLKIVKVTLEVKGEVQLKNLSEKLTSNDIAHKLWIEQPENTPTCLASKPYPKSVVS
ncbi:Peptidyl-tRNA hydrolase II domain-containing protein, partial [Cynara cardunculus var. scolymus]